MDTRSSLHRNSHSTFVAPPTLDATSDCCTGDSTRLSPFRKSFPDTICLNPSVYSSVALLFGRSRPSTVGWFIVAKRVRVAIQRMLRRGLTPHYCQELSVRFKQEFHTQSPVSVITFISQTFTSGFSRVKRAIFNRASFGFPVNCARLRNLFAAPASTRNRSAPSQITTDGKHPFATVTFAQPQRPSFFTGRGYARIANNVQSAKALITKVCDFTTMWWRSGVQNSCHNINISKARYQYNV